MVLLIVEGDVDGVGVVSMVAIGGLMSMGYLRLRWEFELVVVSMLC